MSLQKSTEPLAAPVSTGVHRKPKPDLYTVLLAIALAAVIIGIVFLYLEMNEYEFKMNGGPTVVMESSQRSAFGHQFISIDEGDRTRQMRPFYASLIPNP